MQEELRMGHFGSKGLLVKFHDMELGWVVKLESF